MLVEVFEIALQQGGDVKMVGATLFAETAFHAVIHLLHLLVELVVEVYAIRRTTQEEIHAVAALNLDAHRAGLAVAAAAAKIATQLLAVFLDTGAHLVVQFWRILLERDKLVQLALALYAPDRLYVGKLCQIGVGCGSVVNKTSCQALHGDKAHVVVATALRQGMLLLVGQIGEGELQINNNE